MPIRCDDLKPQDVYYILMLACFLQSLRYLKFYRIRLLSLLLFISIITELCVEFYKCRALNYYIFYHFFNVAEYGLISLILIDCIDKPIIKKLILWSIPAYALASFYISSYIQPVVFFPAYGNNIEGLLVMSWCIIALLSITPNDNRTIFQRSSFWIILAFYLYFIVTLPFNGIFNPLMKNEVMRTSAKRSFNIINSVGNCCSYAMMLVGLFFYKWKKSIQQS